MLTSVGVVALVGIATGCAPALRRGTEAGIEGTLETMAEPENRERLQTVAASPEMQESARALTAAVTQGVVQGMKEELGKVDLDQATSKTMATVGEGTEKVLRENVAPGVAAIVQRTLDASLASAASDRNLERTHKIVSSTTDAAIRGMTKALAVGIREDVVPALKDAKTDMQPLAAQILGDEDFRAAVGGIVHEVSKQAVLGSESALDDIQQFEDPNQDGSFLGPIADKATMWGIGIAVISGMGLGLLVLLVLVVRSSAQRRHLERESWKRDEMMLAMMQAMNTNQRAIPQEQLEALERMRAEAAERANQNKPQERKRRGGFLRGAFGHG